MNLKPKQFRYTATMIIDNDAISSFIVERIITKSNFSSEIHVHKAASTAIDFLISLEKSDDHSLIPSYIFLDHYLPICNGFCFLEELEKLNLSCLQNTKIIFLSNSLDPNDKEKAMSFKNVNCFLQKPLKFSDLDVL